MSPFLSQSVYNIHTHECLGITFGPPQKLAATFTSEQLGICATVNITSKQMIQWFVFVHGREQGRTENSRNSSLKVQLSAASHTDCAYVHERRRFLLSSDERVRAVYLCR